MKRSDEFLVGLVVLVTLAVIVGGALWLSETHLGRSERVLTARFRTLGSLGVGDPVVLRGVRVGRVQEIRLAPDNWVEADLVIWRDVDIPPDPAVIAASASLFGEWTASLVSLEQARADPNVREALTEAYHDIGDKVPGATLPDVGQLTAEASRIATDIAAVANRVQEAFDSAAVEELRGAIADFGRISDRIARLTNEQANVIGSVGQNLERGSELLAAAAGNLQTSLVRVDSATNQGQLQTILTNMAATSGDVRQATEDLGAVVTALRDNQESVVRILLAADSAMTRVANRSGTLGLMLSDSTLYREATLALIQLRQLLSDVQANPRKYFKFSVF